MTAMTQAFRQASALAHAPFSESLQASVLEVLDEGVVVVGLDGLLIHANAAASAILMVDLAAAAQDPTWEPWGQSVGARQPDGSPDDFGESVLSTGQGLRDVEIDIDRPDGASRSLSVNYLPLRDGGGAINGVVISFRDVTEAQRERRGLVALHERLSEVHEVARLASWEWSPDTGDVVIFQAVAEGGLPHGLRMTSEEWLAGQSPDEREASREAIAAMVRGERDESARRHRHVLPTGRIWLETRMRAVRAADDRLLCIRGTSQDVTEQELARLELASALGFSQGTVDSLADHIAVLDDTGEIVMTNRAWDEFAVANGGTLEGTATNYLAACDAAPDDVWAARAGVGLRAIISGEQTAFSMEYPCHSPLVDRWFKLRAARYDGPGNARVVVAHEDVTQRHHAEGQVATQAALLDEVDVAVIATSPEGVVTHWNRRAELLYGWTHAEAVGSDVRELVVPEDDSRSSEIVEELRRVGRWEGEFIVRAKDGTAFPAHVSDRMMVDGDGRPLGMVGVSADISERVASERALLHTRNYLRAVTDNMGEGLFTLDTDGRLTYINRAAEDLLGWSAEELAGCVFHDIMHSKHPDGSAFPMHRCPITLGRQQGVTTVVEDDTFFRRDGHQLSVAYTATPFETADGVEGSAVVFRDISEEKTRAEALRRDQDKLLWIGRVQNALEEDRFVLYAQPIIDLRTHEVVQQELLLRMREPDGQITGPGAFLAVAEQYGQIGEIDRWVIEQAADLVRVTGAPFELNLSARSISDPEVLEHIESCIERSGADPRLLVFEITETALVEDAPAARAFAERLHALGCKLALDDFGTGYGGFTYLKQLPVDILKIDVEFVRDLASNPGSRHVVQAVVALAHGFGLKTVAEGVEDAETLDLLPGLGVDFAQGFHIARPAPLEQLHRRGRLTATTPEAGEETR